MAEKRVPRGTLADSDGVPIMLIKKLSQNFEETSREVVSKMLMNGKAPSKASVSFSSPLLIEPQIELAWDM